MSARLALAMLALGHVGRAHPAVEPPAAPLPPRGARAARPLQDLEVVRRIAELADAFVGDRSPAPEREPSE